MSLFDELQQWELIEKPKHLGQYRKILEEHKEKPKEKTWKEIRDEKKLEMPKEEYLRWLRDAWYWNNKDKVADKYQQKKKEQELFIEEIIKEVYNPLPEPINRDKYYLEKFKKDNTNSEGKYKFGWWKSRIMYDKPLQRYRVRDKPIRIITRKWLPEIYARTQRIEQKAYEYIKPHINEIDIKDFWLAKEQIISKYPLWLVRGKMRELVDATDIPRAHLCSVASALIRDVYIASEVYMWRNSFIIWDVIVTDTGALFPISLENNLPWLTKDTVEEYHKMRLTWHQSKKAPSPPIYKLPDCYLLKIPINERETYWYIVPYKNNFISKK